MKRLIYGVGLAASRWDRPLPAGPASSATNVLRQGELAAAYATAAVLEASPATACLLAYARVIEQLHRRGPFAPMRFGCQLADEGAIRNLLQVRQDEFLAMLDEITGCDEFGLRILCCGAEPLKEEPDLSTEGGGVSETAEPGRSYLNDLRKRYARLDAQRHAEEQTATNYRKSFEGLYVRCQPAAAGECWTASLSFLVRRSNQPCFHQRFRALEAASSDKLLLTGPWPPYHFVALAGAETSSTATLRRA